MSILGVQGVKMLKTNLSLGENQFGVATVIFLLWLQHFRGNLHKQLKPKLINYSIGNVTTMHVALISPRKTLFFYLPKATPLAQ